MSGGTGGAATTCGATAGGATAGGATAGGATASGGATGSSNTGGGGAMTGGSGAGTTSGSGGASCTAEAGGAGGDPGEGGAGSVDPNFYVFLLIGQSNMEGQPQPEPEDQTTDERVKVLAYDNCPNLSRSYNEWYTAAPPLHSCSAGVGPGDYFGRALAAAYPNATIGLVPCAISGVDIDFFRKCVTSRRRAEFGIPPDNHWGGAYEWVVERARRAQRSGVIRGIIFHQGESDTGQTAWVAKVKEMVTDLRTDLGLGDVPFIAAELLYGGCCASHNPLINRLPNEIANTAVISASGLMGSDGAHFDLAAQRELGARYGQKMIEMF
jgi:hypothetical protein